MPDLRTALSEALGSAEELPSSPPEQTDAASAPSSPPIPEPAAPAASSDDRPRDEAGRFVAGQGKPAEAAPVAQVAPAAPEPIQRPSTWKKDYWPLWDKLNGGQPLSPEEARQLANYANQRENEFKAGVSTYKAEADRSKEIWDAIAPFMPDLQRYNIQPGKWIANLGAAHKVMAFGSPAEKAAMVTKLAAEYGVPLDQLGQAPQLDPQTKWLADQLAAVQGKLGQFESLQQQREQQQMTDMVTRVRDERDASGKLLRPHFETVREQMAGLLSSGFAQSLEDAYVKAVRLNDDLYREQTTLQTQGAQAAAVVAKAKAAAISPKSASPRGDTDPQPKGRRDILAAQIDSAMGSGRV